jgi:hypothetical protein
MIRIPCQVARTGRRIIGRLLNGNQMQPVFWRLVDVLQLQLITEAFVNGHEFFGLMNSGSDA